MTTVLMKFAGFRVARLAFPELYLQQYGQPIRPKDLGHRNLDQVIAALPHVVEVGVWFLFCAFLKVQT